jgi:fluoroacetyl-CoA thioesterase
MTSQSTAKAADDLVGRWADASVEVTPAATAIAAGSGDLPVLATPRMIALMEEAACNVLAGALPDEATSVGTRVDVRHTAPSPLGARITARAAVVGVDGARVTFEVTAWHGPVESSVEIGRGTHVRVVVDRETFLSSL